MQHIASHMHYGYTVNLQPAKYSDRPVMNVRQTDKVEDVKRKNEERKAAYLYR